MTKVATTNAFVTDVVKKELWMEEKWCREAGTVTVVDGMDVGQVLEKSGDTWAAIAADPIGQVGILVDETVVEKDAGDHTLAVLVSGPAIVFAGALTLGGTATEAAVITALETAGIRVDK
jgi:hypothetical protein